MKKSWIYCITLLFAMLLILALPVAGEEDIYTDVIRLHVLANSDREEDQAVKLAVRDAILQQYGQSLSKVESKAEAEALATSLLPAIEQTANDVLARKGYSHTAKVMLCEEAYSTRVYQDVTLPAGNYLSLRVIIGSGEGKNWWCVLYPPLCVSLATEQAVSAEDSLPVGLTPEEYRLICQNDKPYKLKFKSLEVLQKMFS